MATAETTDLDQSSIGVGDWQLITADSAISFETRIVLGMIPVRGRFSDCEGELHVDGAGNASGELRVDAETLSTGIKKRDRHLRSSDFFAVEEHRHLVFELGSLQPASDGSAHLTGTLRVRGHALAIETPVEIAHPRPDTLRVSADFAIDHRSAGLDETGPGWKKVPEKLRAHVALTLARTA